MSRPILRLITVALVWLTGLSPALAQSHLASAVFAGRLFLVDAA